MADYKIQLEDERGNRQYPVSTTDVVVDADGVSVATLLSRKQDRLVSGQNIKTINGKSILGSGDLVIEGGGGTSDDVEAYPIYYPIDDTPLTDEQKAANKMAIEKYVEAYEAYDSLSDTPILYPYLANRSFPFNVYLFGTDGSFNSAQLVISGPLAADDGGVLLFVLDFTIDAGTGDVTINFADVSSLASHTYVHAYVDSKIQGGGGTGEAVESDVISVVYDDDQLITLSNVEAFNKLAECCETVGKPVAVMVCIESGYRWGIEHFYWSKKDEEIELVSPIRKDGMYATFTLTHEGACTASFGQVNLGSNPNNAKMFALNSPFFGAGGELVTLDYARTALDTDFDFEIPQEIKDWWYNYVTGLIDENVATMAQIEECWNNGEKILIVIKTRSLMEFILALYLWAYGEGGSFDATTEEIVELLEMSEIIEEYAYPKAYEISPPVDGEQLVINVTGDTLGLSIDASGDWTKNGEIVKTTYNLFYEAGARLDKERCDANLIAMNRPLNYTDISVCEFKDSNGTYSTRDVLIISRKDKTVENFPDLDGSVNTREVASFYYLEGTNMYELQVSKYDGYCRRVSLGELAFK